MLALAGRAPSSGSAGTLSVERFVAVSRAVEERLGDRLALADLAGFAGISPYHFARAFKARTGRSPCRFVAERRLARACELLRESDTPIVDVAATCGYSSQSHMTTVFSRDLGTSPARYRRRLKRGGRSTA